MTVLIIFTAGLAVCHTLTFTLVTWVGHSPSTSTTKNTAVGIRHQSVGLCNKQV